MNSLDFYLALLCGCKRDVARLAGKVGGLTDCVFTGLCGALPEAKEKGGGVQGAYSKGNRGMGKIAIFLVVVALVATFGCGGNRKAAIKSDVGIMTVTTSARNVQLLVAGSGTVTIDWGDGPKEQIMNDAKLMLAWINSLIIKMYE